MEIRLPPEKEAHLAALAASTGRSTDELVLEAIELWEEENARALVEFRKTLDAVEGSIARGEGIPITRENLRALAEDVKQRGRKRLAASSAPR